MTTHPEAQESVSGPIVSNEQIARSIAYYRNTPTRVWGSLMVAALTELQSRRAAQQAEVWRPLEDADKARSDLVGGWPCSVRWKPYKLGSFQSRHGIKGRWQRASSEYGGWDNCDPPAMVRALEPIEEKDHG